MDMSLIDDIDLRGDSARGVGETGSRVLLGSISILLELLNPCECECDCLIGDPPKLKPPSLIALCLATRSAASC